MFFFVFFGFSRGFFTLPSPIVQKLEENQKNKKNNPVRRILGKSIQDCFFFLVFFGLLFDFSRGFCCPKPNCPKTRGKPKKTKKTNPVRRILGKSIQDCFFCFFWFIWFFSRFLLSQAQLSKNSRKTKKNKKTNPVRRILGKSIQDCFFWFFWFIWFFSRFLLSQAQLSKNSRKTKKNKKNNPVRRILGKSIQDCFFWFIWFFSRFLLPQAQLSKNSRQQNYLCRKT